MVAEVRVNRTVSRSVFLVSIASENQPTRRGQLILSLCCSFIYIIVLKVYIISNFIKFRCRPSDLWEVGGQLPKKNRARQTSNKKKSCKSATTKKMPALARKKSCSPKATKKKSCTKKLPTPLPGDLMVRPLSNPLLMLIFEAVFTYIIFTSYSAGETGAW